MGVKDEMVEWMNKNPTFRAFATMEEARNATVDDFERLKVQPRVNERGNRVYPGSRHGDRYLYDFKVCTKEKGWRQYDTSQDAWYFGMWVHMEEMLTFTYCEGDLTLVVCPTKESFKAELDNAAEFYGAPPPAFVAFSFDEPGKVTRTEVYDARPSSAEVV